MGDRPPLLQFCHHVLTGLLWVGIGLAWEPHLAGEVARLVPDYFVGLTDAVG